MAIVGHAYVEIRALSNKFNKDIQKSLNDSLGGVGKDLGKQVGDDFSAEYKKTVEAKLGKGLKLPSPDTKDATKKIRELGDEVDTLHARMKRGSSTVRNFSRSIKDLDNHLLKTFGSMFKFGGGFSGLLMTLDSAGAILGSILGPLSALASGLVALSAAVAPAAKSVAILPGLFAALGTAAVSATLSLSGLGDAYKAGAAAAAGGEKELEKYREALKKLNPQQADFVEHLLRHKDAIDAVKNSASEEIFEGLSVALDRITRNGFLDILADGLRDAGGALGYVAAQAASLTGKPFFQRSFSRVMDSNVKIIDDLGKSFLNLVGYFTLVADAARPFTEYFAAWVETVTGNWLSKAQGDFHGLRGSIADGVQVAQQLGDIFGNIGESLGNIGRAARPAGRILLNAFEGATEKFAEFTGSTAGQERMREFFLNTTDTVKSLGNLIVSVSREFGKLGENPAFADMIDTLANSTVPKLAESMDRLVTVVGDDFIGIFDTLAEIGEVMADSGGLESYLEVMQGFLDVIKSILEIPGFAKLAGKLLAITGAIKGLSLVTKFVGVEWLIATGLPGLKSKATGVAAALAPILVALSAIEVFRTNPITGTGENPGQGEGSILPKAPKFLDDFTKSLGDPDGLGRGAIRGFFAGIEDELTKLLEDPDSFGRGAIKDWWKDIWAPEGLWADIKDNWSGIWEDLGSWVSDEWADLKEEWQNIDWSDVGRNIIDGVIRGVRSNPLVRTIEITARAAINKFKDIFGIKSPSRVFAGFGRDIVAGLVSGIKSIPNVVGGIFRSTLRVSATAWKNISKSVGDAARSAGESAGKAFTDLRSRTGDIFRSIGRAAGTAWRNIRTSISNVVQSIASGTITRFNRMKTSVVGAFNSAKNGISKAWNGIRAAARGPVEYVVNTVFNNGLRKAFNVINNVIPGLPDIAPVHFGGGSSAGGSRPASDRGFAVGGWTGPGSKYQPAGVVHADEFVIKKESRKRIEQRLPGVLDYMNQKGTLPGYAGGGLVDAARWWQALGARPSEHPLFGGVHAGHMKNSLHYSGRAVDLNFGPAGENNIEKAFFDKYIGQFKARFPSLGVLWRVADHFNHMHIDTSGYGRGSGGGLPDLASLLKPFGGLVEKLKSGAGSGGLGKLLLGSGKRLISGSIDLVKSKFNSMLEGAGDVVGSVVGGVKSAGAKAAVRGLAFTRGWGSGAQWNALDWLVNKESGWNPNAANPTSSARGLFQKMTSIHGPVESTALGQAKWGLDYIAKRYGNPIKAMQFHKSHGYYADGGLVKNAPIFDNGGVLARGLNLVNNQTGGPEALVRPEQFSPKGLAAEYRKLIQVIERAFGTSGQMSSAGAQVVSGLISGLKSGAGAVRSASSDVAHTVINTARDLLQIKSPSRVFRGFGLNIDNGLVAGILDGREELSKVLAKTLDNIMDYADDRVDASADNILESYRRANQRIREYNRTHKNDKDSLQVPTRKQAEERAMERLGYSKKGLARAKSLIIDFNRTTKNLWKEGSSAGTARLIRVAERFRLSGDLLKRISLADLAKGAEILGSRLEKAREKLSSIVDLHQEMSSGIASGITGSLDLTSTSTPTTPTSSITIQTVSTQIKSLAGKAKALAGLLRALVKSGMPTSFVQQIAGLGIDEATSVSKAILAGTRRQQRTLYADFKSVDVNARKVGDVVADQMYEVGINAARGLVQGLESDQRALTRAAGRLARKLEKEVKRALGIRSPSRVFAELGKFLPLGLVEGIQSSTSAAVNAVTTLASEMSSAFSPDLTADASLSGASLAGISQVGRRSSTAAEYVDADGLTAGERAIITAIAELASRPNMTINPPAEMDIRTLATLVARELEFSGK